jgi:hypothetical protein
MSVIVIFLEHFAYGLIAHVKIQFFVVSTFQIEASNITRIE